MELIYSKSDVYSLFLSKLATYRGEHKYTFNVVRRYDIKVRNSIYFDINYNYDTGEKFTNRYRLFFRSREDHYGPQVLPSELEIELAKTNNKDVGTVAYETNILSLVLGQLQKELKLRGAKIEGS